MGTGLTKRWPTTWKVNFLLMWRQLTQGLAWSATHLTGTVAEVIDGAQVNWAKDRKSRRAHLASDGGIAMEEGIANDTPQSGRHSLCLLKSCRN